jgi:putative colanic acid biosynthesis UDP-glucose lipid carrier transferase
MDLIFLNTSIGLFEFLFNHASREYEQTYLIFRVGANIGWVIIAWIANVYSLNNLFSFEVHTRQSMHAWCYWLIAVMLYWFFAHQFKLSRLFIASSVISFGGGLLVNRFVLLFLRSYYKGHRNMSRKVMIIGYNNMAKKLASYLEEDMINTEIVGFCEETENVHELSNYPIIDSVNNCISASRQYHVNEIYSTIAPEQHAGIYRLMQEADRACIHFRLIPDLSHFVKRTFYINYLKDIPVLSLRQEPLSDAGNRIRKRAFDVVVSSLVLVFILSWLIPLMALAICLESPGPVFFRQQRTGRNKKVFYCLKFRSMVVNGDAHTRQASANDSRVTRIGKFIRRTNLDEFPQFLNVLKGEMSIVGPRPHMLKHTTDYSRMIDKYMIRQFLKPGITGWAQIHGYRGEIKTLEQLRERVEHDIWYMENWSLWLDVRIMFLTLMNMIIGQKNAF